MRIAVISDIHGNDVAFAAVVADFQGDDVDQVVCCGDALQGGAQPAEVVRRLQELDCPVVMGNADDFLLKGNESDNEEPPDAWHDAVREWQLPLLSRDDLAFVAAFPPTVEIPLPNGKHLLCAHGSPQHFNHIIMPDTPEDEVRAMLGPIEGVIVCGGHTHLQQFRQLGTCFFFNPGSVSLPNRQDVVEGTRRVNRWAEYAVLTVTDSGRETVEFRRVPYDVDRVLALIDASGMPDGQRLRDYYQSD
jgi:predicted phosphodiesterase